MLDLAVALQLLIYGLTNGAVVALNAIGFTIAYAVARQINLAHGNVFVLTTIAVVSLSQALGLTGQTPWPTRLAALALLVLVGALVGAVLNGAIERLAFRPFQKVRDPLGPLIASVALSYVLLQSGIWFYYTYYTPSPGTHQGVNIPLRSMADLVPPIELDAGAVVITLKDALLLVVACLVAVGVMLVLTRTRLGRLLRAVSQDPEAAALCGVDPARAQTLAFVVAGALAGLGAAMFAGYYGVTPAQQGLGSGLAIMTAAVLGGVGDPRGALLGGVALGVVASFSDFVLSAQWTPVLVLLLLVALLAFRPSGLFGTAPTRSSEDVAPPPPAIEIVQSSTGGRWAWVAVLALAVAVPWLDLATGGTRLSGAVMTLVVVTLAVGLSIVVGFAGLLDLGYAAFFAIGAYTAAALTSTGSHLAPVVPGLLREPWLSIPLAAIVAAGFGFLFGLPSIRTRGEYLAIVTLAFGEIVPLVINQTPDWTGGPRGVSGIPLARLLPGAGTPILNAYAIALVLVAVVCAAAVRLARSRIGRAWAAVRNDELAAATVGVNPPRLKLLAFTLGAAFAGAAGAVFAGFFGYVEPSQFTFTLSLMVLAAVVIGVRWGLLGAVIAAAVLSTYERVGVEAISAVLHAVGATIGIPALAAADLRGQSFVVFGLALYLATLLRARPLSVGPLRRPVWPRQRVPRPVPPSA